MTMTELKTKAAQLQSELDELRNYDTSVPIIRRQYDAAMSELLQINSRIDHVSFWGEDF